MQANSGEQGPKQVNTQTVIGEIIENLHVQIQASDIQLVIGKFLPTVKTDQHKITEIFRNLIINALHHLKDLDNAQLEIGVKEHNQLYRFYIKDNGKGLPPKDQERIFELFYTTEESTDNKGIGLTVVKGYVEDLGGQIWVESEGEKGSTFWFTLPKHPPNRE